MKPYAAVIAEYNPFHFGHEYQLQRIKEDIGGCVCVMSSFAVQRGELATSDKYSRARAAVKSGASLVLENPFPWCSASASDFAASGVRIAHGTGAKYLAFGVQTDIRLLREIADFRKSAECSARLASLIKDGVPSYPKALGALISDVFGREAEAEMQKPNNILAVEYLLNLPDDMAAYPIMRDERFRSASEIRESGDMAAFVPDESRLCLQTAALKNAEYESVFLMALLRRNIAKKDIYGAEEGLTNLVSNALRSSVCVSDIIKKCTNASYTASRVRRFLLHTAFGVTKGKVLRKNAYTMLLAADGCGREILREGMKMRTVTKPADGLRLRGEAGKQFRFAIEAETAASSVLTGRIYLPLTSSPYIKA